MDRLDHYAWIAFSAIVIVGYLALTYALMFRPLVVGDEREWEFIKIGYGAFTTIFITVINSWIHRFTGSKR